MTNDKAPDGLEVVAWRFHDGETWVYLNHIVDYHHPRFTPLVTLASAQAAVAARDKLIMESYPLIEEAAQNITALEAALRVARSNLIKIHNKGCNWSGQTRCKDAIALIDTTLNPAYQPGPSPSD